MPKKQSLRDRLRQAGIRHYDELIHDQPKEWLIQNTTIKPSEEGMRAPLEKGANGGFEVALSLINLLSPLWTKEGEYLRTMA